MIKTKRRGTLATIGVLYAFFARMFSEWPFFGESIFSLMGLLNETSQYRWNTRVLAIEYQGVCDGILGYL